MDSSIDLGILWCEKGVEVELTLEKKMSKSFSAFLGWMIKLFMDNVIVHAM